MSSAAVAPSRPGQPLAVRLALVLVVMMFAFIASGTAQAQDDDPGERAYQECQSREYDSTAAQRVKNDLSGDELDRLEKWQSENNGVVTRNGLTPGIKELFPEKFEDKRDEIQNDQGNWNKLERTAIGGKCHSMKPVNQAVNEVSDKISKFWDESIGGFVESMMEGNTELLKMVMTFWLEVGINSESTMTFADGITNMFYPVAVALFIISFMVCGTVVLFKRKEGLGDGLETAGGFVGKYLVFGGMIPLSVPVALMGTDFAAQKLLDTFLPDEQSMDELFESTMLAKESVNPWVMLLIMLFASAGSLMQIIALAIRTLVMPLAVGMMPIYAAGIQIPPARASLYKLVAWSTAAVSMPVLAACVYIVAFWIAGDPNTAGGDGAMSTLMRVLVLGSAGWAPLTIVALFAAFAGGTGGNRSGALAAAGGGFLGSAMGSVGSALAGGGSGSGGSSSNAQMGATGGPSGPGGGSSGGATGSTGGPSGPSGSSPSGSSGGGGGGATASGSSGGSSGSGGGQSTPSGSQPSSGGGSSGSSRAASGGSTPSGSRSGSGGTAPALLAASQMAQGARTGVQDLDSAFDDAVGTIPDGGVIRK